jgi:hypothetical protein
VTVFPGEIHRAPRSWTQRAYRNLIYFNEIDKGGQGLRKTESSDGISHDADILPSHFPSHNRGTPCRNTTQNAMHDVM